MTRSHDVSQLTTAELELTRRQLRTSLALIAPGSPAQRPRSWPILLSCVRFCRPSCQRHGTRLQRSSLVPLLSRTRR